MTDGNPLSSITWIRGSIHSHQLKGMRWPQLILDRTSLTLGGVTDGCRIYRASELSHVQHMWRLISRTLEDPTVGYTNCVSRNTIVAVGMSA